MGSRFMQPLLGLYDSNTIPESCDTIIVELHDSANYNLVRSDKVLIRTSGSATIIYMPTILYPDTILGLSYYIAIRSRNAVETWSKEPVRMNAVTLFDFTIR